MDLGLSDHYAQSISIPSPEIKKTPYKTKKRKFNEVNTQEFLYSLKQITWQEIINEPDKMPNSVLFWKCSCTIIILRFQLKQRI